LKRSTRANPFLAQKLKNRMRKYPFKNRYLAVFMEYLFALRLTERKTTDVYNE